jgi:hypothetical protein
LSFRADPWNISAVTDDDRILDGVRQHLRTEFNGAIRRPSMYGGEIAIRIYLRALDVAHGHDRASAEIKDLQPRGAFTSLGVPGAFAQIWPGLKRPYPRVTADTSDMAPSVYAEIGRHHGWLDLDRTLTPAEYGQLRRAAAPWCREDRTATDVLDTFGQPSIRIGSTGARWPKTFLYATAQPSEPCVSFHLWNGSAGSTPGAATAYPEPMLLAVRTEGGPFQDSFTHTPIGQALTMNLER